MHDKVQRGTRGIGRGGAVALLLAVVSALLLPSSAQAVGELEKDELKFGFIKLTDCAALVIAKENGYFEDEGLFVTLEAQGRGGGHQLAGMRAAAQEAVVGRDLELGVARCSRHLQAAIPGSSP